MNKLFIMCNDYETLYPYPLETAGILHLILQFSTNSAWIIPSAITTEDIQVSELLQAAAQ